jgi:para-aminobenzoate synthetase component I
MQEKLDFGFEKMDTLGGAKIPFVAIIDFNLSEVHVLELHELQKENIQVVFPTYTNVVNSAKVDIQFTKKEIAFADYKNGFETILKNIQHGDSFLCNYTCSTKIETKNSLHEIFTTSISKYKLFYKDEWVSFSPEIFIRITNNTISTYPMKGTIDASLPDAASIIMQDQKEIAEHFTIVDLMRNDLNMVAENVVVKKFRYIDEIRSSQKNLLQVSSCIEGILPNNWHSQIGHIIKKILPAGSISGAPKNKTLQIIANAEFHQRGFYTGTAFYFDGESLDSCVLIRFIEKTKEGFVYKSGGGITFSSKLENEYGELNDKIYIPN